MNKLGYFYYIPIFFNKLKIIWLFQFFFVPLHHKRNNNKFNK